MTKPFDLVELETRLKAQGITAIEGLAEIVTNVGFQWIEDSLALEANPIFNIATPVLMALKPMILSEEKKMLDDSVTAVTPAPVAAK